jgi:hypothetical protein
MRYAALVVLGGDDPHLARQCRRDPFADREAGRLDAVVIGQQNTVEHTLPPVFSGRAAGLAPDAGEIEIGEQNALQIAPAART